MPYQIKNGIVYGSNAVSLTQAQYDALSTAEKNNGTVYYIYDSEAVLDASEVSLGSGTVEDLAGSVAVIETSPATATHTVGSYIVYNGQLYKVTSAISTGATLTPGTNISAVSVGGELTSLNNGLKIVKYEGTHTITTTGDVIIDISSSIPSGKRLIAVLGAQVGFYPLPYMAQIGSGKCLYIESANMNTKVVKLKNTGTGDWNNYTVIITFVVG